MVAGLAEAKRKGVQLGRPRDIDAAKVQALHRKGQSMAAIAREVGPLHVGGTYARSLIPILPGPISY